MNKKKMRRSNRLAWIMIATFLGATYSSAVPVERCPAADAKLASRGAGEIKSWADIHQEFKRFAHCDDGATAEGYSNSVVGLLVNRWSEIAVLSKIVKSDPNFQKFVVSHIDELMTPQQFTIISNHAIHDCPDASRSLCAAISEQLQRLK